MSAVPSHARGRNAAAFYAAPLCLCLTRAFSLPVLHVYNIAVADPVTGLHSISAFTSSRENESAATAAASFGGDVNGDEVGTDGGRGGENGGGGGGGSGAFSVLADDVEVFKKKNR